MAEERIARGLAVVRRLSDDQRWKTTTGVRPSIDRCRAALEALEDAIEPASPYRQRWRERLRRLLEAMDGDGPSAAHSGTWETVPEPVALAARQCLAPLPVPDASPLPALGAPRRAGTGELHRLQRCLEDLAAEPGVRGVLLLERGGDLVAAAGDLDEGHEDPSDAAVPVTDRLALVLLAEPGATRRARHAALRETAGRIGDLLLPFEA